MKRKAMTCREGVAKLVDYLEGTLTASQRRQVDSHVEGCVRCQRFARSYGETPRIVRQATDATVPRTLSLALRRRLKAQR